MVGNLDSTAEDSSASDDQTRRRVTLAVIAVAILLGVGFRCYAIDRHLFWNDEIYTSFRIAGFRDSEIESELRDQPIFRVADLRHYQVLTPTKTMRDTVQGLAEEEPQLTPLYFILARQWIKTFGTSISAVRSLSVLFGLLALPCVFWLCRELFKSTRVGLIATAVVAISPAQVVFAQEARPYSLYVLTVLLSSIALLRAIRCDSVGNWTIYAVSVAIGLYTQILFGMVALGHTIYVFTITRFAVCRTSIRYVIASAVALASFVPWLLVFISAEQTGTSWTQAHQSLMASAIRWAGIVSRSFLDLGVSPSDSLRVKLSVLPFVALTLLLIAYSIYFLVRQASKQQWLFVGTLIASIALPLLLMDTLLSRRYGTTRYILPSIVGIQLSVAYLLSIKISDNSLRPWRRKSWQLIGVMLVVGGTVSCSLRSAREMWWNKSPTDYGDYPQIARIVNQSDEPVIFCYGEWRFMQIISNRLDPNVRMQLLSDDKLPQLPRELDEVYLFNTTEAIRSDVEQSYDVRVEQTLGVLWKIVRTGEGPPTKEGS